MCFLSFASSRVAGTSERIRDKIAAIKAKGIWSGGALAVWLTRSKEGNSQVIEEEKDELVRLIVPRLPGTRQR